MREVGGNCLKYLKRGKDRKDGRRGKDFKQRGQAGTRGGCLKKGVAGTPLRSIILESKDIHAIFQKKGKKI